MNNLIQNRNNNYIKDNQIEDLIESVYILCKLANESPIIHNYINAIVIGYFDNICEIVENYCNENSFDYHFCSFDDKSYVEKEIYYSDLKFEKKDNEKFMIIIPKVDIWQYDISNPKNKV